MGLNFAELKIHKIIIFSKMLSFTFVQNYSVRFYFRQMLHNAAPWGIIVPLGIVGCISYLSLYLCAILLLCLCMICFCICSYEMQK